MIKRVLILLMSLAAGLHVMAGEVEDALKTVNAPSGDFVRMPARYVFQRMERQAKNSGVPILGGFSIEVRLEDLGAKKINISFVGMDLLEALENTAKATGSYLIFENNTAVFGDESLVAVESQALPEEPEVEEMADDDEVEFSDVDSALVFVETGVGRGSAFVAEQGGKVYIFSNQHNFMGANKLELQSMHHGLLDVDSFEFCRSRDLVRFELDPPIAKKVGVLKLASENPTIDQEIVVYGNSAGGNVATELRGEVLGVGPRDIEVSAEIVPGNSGSPILDEKGRVIGVATYVAFELKFEKNDQRMQIYKGTRFKKARRYGVRIPSDGWTKVNMRSFLEQTYKIADWKSYLELTGVLVGYWGGLENYEDYEDAAKQVMESYSSKSSSVDRPYGFHDMEMELDVEMAVKAFKRNFEEFRQLVRKADLDKKDMAKMSNADNSFSQSKIERLDYYIRTMMLSKAKKLQEEIKAQNWMSEYLEESASDVERMAGELVLRLEGKTNILPRLKAVND